MIPIYCQICEERIAMADHKDLSVPIHGDMFVSPYPDRMPESIIQPAEWEFIRCPYCNTRPFIRDDEVLTDKGGILQTNDGVYRIPIPSQPNDIPEYETSESDYQPIDTFKTVFACECCDPPREFKNKAGRSSHIRAMRRKK